MKVTFLEDLGGREQKVSNFRILAPGIGKARV